MFWETITVTTFSAGHIRGVFRSLHVDTNPPSSLFCHTVSFFLPGSRSSFFLLVFSSLSSSCFNATPSTESFPIKICSFFFLHERILSSLSSSSSILSSILSRVEEVGGGGCKIMIKKNRDRVSWDPITLAYLICAF
jgi:hypothetical protein